MASRKDKFNNFLKIIKDNNSDIKLTEDSMYTLTFEEYKGVKTYYYIKNNIKLIRIPYWDFDKIETILFKELN